MAAPAGGRPALGVGMTGPRSAALLLALAVAAWWMVLAGDRQSPALAPALAPGVAPGVAEGPPLLAGLAGQRDDATRIEIRQGDGAVTLTRTPDGPWQIPAFGGYPAETAQVDRLLTQLSAITQAGVRTALADLHPVLGVDPPGPGAAGQAIRVVDDDETLLAGIVLGDVQRAGTWIGAPGRYARLEDAAQVWLVDGAPTVSADPATWIDQPIAEISPRRIARITVTDDAGRARGWQRIEPGDIYVPEPGTAAVTPPDAIPDLLRDWRVERAAPAGDFGPPNATIIVETFDGLALDLGVHDTGDGPWLTVTVRFTPVAAPFPDAARARHDVQTPAETGQDALSLRAATAGFALRPAHGDGLRAVLWPDPPPARGTDPWAVPPAP